MKLLVKAAVTLLLASMRGTSLAHSAGLPTPRRPTESRGVVDDLPATRRVGLATDASVDRLRKVSVSSAVARPTWIPARSAGGCTARGNDRVASVSIMPTLCHFVRCVCASHALFYRKMRIPLQEHMNAHVADMESMMQCGLQQAMNDSRCSNVMSLIR